MQNKKGIRIVRKNKAQQAQNKEYQGYNKNKLESSKAQELPTMQAKATQEISQSKANPTQSLRGSETTEAIHKHNIKDKEKSNNNTQEKELKDLQSEIDLLKSQDFNTLHNEIQSIKILLDSKMPKDSILQRDLNNAINKIETELQATQSTQIGVNNALRQELQELQTKDEGLVNEINAIQDYINSNNNHVELSLHLINEKIAELKKDTDITNNEYIKSHDKALKQHGEEQAYLLNRINALEKKINTHIESQISINAHVKSNLKVYENNDIFTDIKSLKMQIDTLTNHFLEIEKKYNEKLENIKQLIPFYKNKSIWELIKMKFQK